MPPKRSAEEALAIVRALKDRYLTPEIAHGAEQGRERLRQLREGVPHPQAPTPAAETPPASPPPEEPAFTSAEREKARAVLAAIRRRLHSNGRKPVATPPCSQPEPWRPKG